MRKALFLFIFVVNAILAIKYSFAAIDLLLLLITSILSYFFFRNMGKLKDNVFVLFVIFYVLFSVHIVALFDMSSTGFFKDVIYPKEYNSLALWGNRLFFVIFTTLSVCQGVHLKKSNITVDNRKITTRSFERIFVFLTFFVYFLAAISIALGLSDLVGDVKIVLPFHLNGLIDELRANVYPFVFAIYVFDCKSKDRPLKRGMLVLFFIYVILEIFVRSSKGAFLFSFLPALELLAFMGLYSKDVVVKKVLPLVLAFLFIYPIVEMARMEGSLTTESVKQAAKSTSNNDGEEHSSPYIRAFLTGVYYTKLVDIISEDQFSFDFRRVPLLISMDFGGVSYMTEVIDGVPSGSKQSSGVTGLCDALLWGGHPLCYIIVVLIILLSFWGDHKSFMQKTPLYKVALFYITYRLLTGRTISFLSDSYIIAILVATFFKVLLTKYYYKKCY